MKRRKKQNGNSGVEVERMREGRGRGVRVRSGLVRVSLCAVSGLPVPVCKDGVELLASAVRAAWINRSGPGFSSADKRPSTGSARVVCVVLCVPADGPATIRLKSVVLLVRPMNEDIADLVEGDRLAVREHPEGGGGGAPLDVTASRPDSDEDEDAASVADAVEPPPVDLLSRSDSEGPMIEAADFRALAEGPAYATLNGRLSPGFSAASSYATLTPLQPLPPISTMSDKFSHYAHHGSGVSSSFALMQNNLGMNFQYEKLGSMSHVMNMSPTLGVTHASAVSMLAANGLGSQSIPSPPYSQNGIHTPPDKSLSPTGFESYTHRDLGSPQSPPTLHTPTSMMQTLNGLNVAPNSPQTAVQLQEAATPSPGQKPSPPMAVPVVSLAPAAAALNVALSIASAIPVHVTVQPAAIVAQHQHQTQPQQLVVATSVVQPPPQPQQQQPQQPPQQQQQQQQQQQSVVTVPNKAVPLVAGAVSPAVSAKSSGDEVEEINTKELAQRISAELKRYSIPQAIFAQRVLCRSQGTLSDLLRNPKPWSKLKSGRETFRRMYKWLEEPEFQRMSALRLAGTVPFLNLMYHFHLKSDNFEYMFFLH